MIVASLLLILVSVGLLVGGVVDGSNPLVVGSIVATAAAIVVLVIGVRQSAAGDVDDADPDEADYQPTGRIAAPVRDNGFRSTRDTAQEGDPSHRSERPSQGDGFDRPDRFDHDEPVQVGRATERLPVMVEEPVAIPAQSVPRAADPYEAGTLDAHTIDAGTFDPGSTLDAEPFDQGTLDGEPYEARIEDAPAAATAAIDDEFGEDPADEPAIQEVAPSTAARVAMLTSDVLVIDGRPRYHVPGCVHLLGRESEPLPVGEAVELGFTPCALCEPDSALLAEARRV